MYMHRSTAIASVSREVPNAREALTKVLREYEDRTRLAMARTTQRAFEHSDTVNDADLHEKDRAIALANHGRNAQIVHGWNLPHVTSNVAVQVNVPLPDKSEREEMRALDRKLDALAAKLKASTP